ncbi:phage major tail tube protein [Xanthobacter sediminis]
MPQAAYVLTGVDVRRAADPESSRIKIITQFNAPGIKNKTIDHAHGGGIGTVKYVLPVLEAFEPTFETMGPDLDSLSAVGLVTGNTDTWVFAGAYLLRGAVKPIASRIIIGGTIAEVDEGTHEGAGANKQMTKHAIHNVTHYERHIDGKQWIYWDVDEMVFAGPDGDMFAAQRAALGI